MESLLLGEIQKLLFVASVFDDGISYNARKSISCGADDKYFRLSSSIDINMPVWVTKELQM